MKGSKLSGGGQLDWLTPLDPRGNLTRETEGGREVVGNHRGNYARYNVVDPEPGTVIQWARNHPDNLLQVRQRGWKVIHQGDGPQSAAAVYQDDSDTPTPLDTKVTCGSLVLVQTSEENFRHLQSETDREALVRLKGSNEAYLSRSEAKGSRLLRRDHGIFFQDGEDVISATRPDEE